MGKPKLHGEDMVIRRGEWGKGLGYGGNGVGNGKGF